MRDRDRDATRAQRRGPPLLSDEFDAPVCEDCVTELEESRRETVPADATFERASKLVPDRGTPSSDAKHDSAPSLERVVAVRLARCTLQAGLRIHSDGRWSRTEIAPICAGSRSVRRFRRALRHKRDTHSCEFTSQKETEVWQGVLALQSQGVCDTQTVEACVNHHSGPEIRTDGGFDMDTLREEVPF